MAVDLGLRLAIPPDDASPPEITRGGESDMLACRCICVFGEFNIVGEFTQELF
jgi:hypothetical protein